MPERMEPPGKEKVAGSRACKVSVNPRLSKTMRKGSIRNLSFQESGYGTSPTQKDRGTELRNAGRRPKRKDSSAKQPSKKDRGLKEVH